MIWSLIAYVGGGALVGLRFRLPAMLVITAALALILAVRMTMLHRDVLESAGHVLLGVALFQLGYLAGLGFAFVLARRRRR